MPRTALPIAMGIYLLTGCQLLSKDEALSDHATSEAQTKQGTLIPDLTQDPSDSTEAWKQPAPEIELDDIDAEGQTISGTFLAGPAATSPLLELAARQGALECSTRASCDLAPDHPSEPPDLWTKLRQGFSFDLALDEPRVQSHIKWFVDHPDYLQRVFSRGALYLPYIVDQVIEAGLPLEIALLPVIESALDPFAYSQGRASGLWQFIPATARLYHIKIDWWYDGRRDIIDSTKAATAFLTDLGARYQQDWPLALSAYNAGAGRVNQAIKRNQRQNKATTFWDLALPKETRNYVPKLLALAAIIRSPDTYGITLPYIDMKKSWAVFPMSNQIDLALAADLAEVPVDDLYRLNPGHNQWATHPQGPYRLLLPQAQIPVMTDNLASYPSEQRITWRRHIIRSGETLSEIADDYQLSVDAILEANQLSGHLIIAGEILMIPTPLASPNDYLLSSDNRATNRLKRYQARYQQPPQEHTVRSGDSLWRIAKQYQVSVRELARWNGLTPKSVLPIGDILFVFQPTPTTDALKISRNPPPQTRPMVRTIYYKIRTGDSLSKIAARFNTSVSAIKTWNPTLTQKPYLHPGDRLRLELNVRNSQGT